MSYTYKIRNLEKKLINKRHYFTRGMLLMISILSILSILSLFFSEISVFFWWYINLFFIIEIKQGEGTANVLVEVSINNLVILIPVLVISIYFIGWGFKELKPKISQYIKLLSGLLFGFYIFFWLGLIVLAGLGFGIYRNIDIVEILLELLHKYFGDFLGSYI